MAGRFAKVEPTDLGKQISPTTGHSFPVPGIGGLYQKPDGTKVFVKPVLDDNAALAEMRATKIAREAHGLNSPEQTIKTMMDPTDPLGKRKLSVLESAYNPVFANPTGGFTKDEYFKQLVAANLRGDKDLQQANLFGNVLADVGPAGVFNRASGARAYEKNMPSMVDQARINLLGVKGGARKFFAESTVGIPKSMTADEYHNSMMKEIDTVLPKLKASIASMQLNKEEKALYASMVSRLEDARAVKWQEMHGIHSAVKISPEKAMTLAAIQKMKETEELRKRQKGHAVSLGDMDFKTQANGFNLGGYIQKREMGGPVNSGQPYMVGERGPELFVPRNSGGIIPNKYGMAKGYNAGGLVKMMIMQLLGMQGGAALGKMSGIPGGEMIGSMLGSMIGFGGMGSGGDRGPKKPVFNSEGGQKAFATIKPLSQTSASLTNMGKAGSQAGAIMSRLGPIFGRLLGSVTPVGLAITAVSTAVLIGAKRWKDHNEHLRIGALQYGMTAEGAKKAGLKFTDYNSKLGDTVKNIAALREKNQLLYESMQSATTPIKMTIEEYKKLKTEVKSNYAEQIKLINQTSGDANLKKVAEDSVANSSPLGVITRKEQLSSS
jgi:hypothetical protein